MGFLAAQLDHPGIVPVHELGLDAEGALYFTMKLVKGSSLLAVFDLARREAEGWTQTRVPPARSTTRVSTARPARVPRPGVAPWIRLLAGG
jgi:hypothetical protein